MSFRRNWDSRAALKKPKRTASYAHEETDGDRPPAWSSLFDVALIEAVLRDAARAGKALSYSETLYLLGHHFSRPKMRALCAALDVVDNRAREQGQPGLAVLVVRASDGLPGAGWWVAKDRRRYQGPWEGPEAKAYIKKKHAEVFRFWRAWKTKR